MNYKAALDAAAALATESPESAPLDNFDAPKATLEIEGFEGPPCVLEARIFSSGNPGWRADVSGTLHGIPVRLQFNALIPKKVVAKMKGDK